jgi:hypothetical protein
MRQKSYQHKIEDSFSVNNLAQTSLATDNVFSDGSSLQIPTVTGDVANGYTLHLTVGISV